MTLEVCHKITSRASFLNCSAKNPITLSAPGCQTRATQPSELIPLLKKFGLKKRRTERGVSHFTDQIELHRVDDDGQLRHSSVC
jgi:hypothetical protein